MTQTTTPGTDHYLSLFQQRADRFTQVVDAVAGRRLGRALPVRGLERPRRRRPRAPDPARLPRHGRASTPARARPRRPGGRVAAQRAHVTSVLEADGVAAREYDGYFGRTTIAATVADFYGWDLVVHGSDVARATGQEWSVSEPRPPTCTPPRTAGAPPCTPRACAPPRSRLVPRTPRRPTGCSPGPGRHLSRAPPAGWPTSRRRPRSSCGAAPRAGRRPRAQERRNRVTVKASTNRTNVSLRSRQGPSPSRKVSRSSTGAVRFPIVVSTSGARRGADRPFDRGISRRARARPERRPARRGRYARTS